MYAYQFNISKKITVRPALQLSYVSRSIDENKLTFGAQYTNDGFVGGSNQENFSSPRISQLDVSSGGILSSSRYWIGFTMNHMNTPDQSFMKGDEPLPMKTSLFAGYKFSFTPEWRKRHVNPDEEKSITPTLLYKMQGTSDQLDIGLYGRYNTLVAGLWYRGVPVKVYKPERSNHDAIIFLVGIIHKGMNIGYSYDLTISKLTALSGGSHELTLSYSVPHKKKKRIQKKLPCPKF
jgi:type IX secretion system PorP/SprF family membrane protein